MGSYKNGFFREDRIDGEDNERVLTTKDVGESYRGFMIYRRREGFDLVLDETCIAMRGGRDGCAHAAGEMLDGYDTFDAVRTREIIERNGLTVPTEKAVA